MIKGVSKTENNYREIYLDSSSSLKDFSFDKKKYYRKHVLNENVEEKSNIAINTGKIVETLLLEEDKFDEKFYISTVSEPPTGLMLVFVEALYSITIENTDKETGKLTTTFEFLTKQAYQRSGYKIKYETVVDKFTNSDAVNYYDELIEVRTKNLTVVSPNEVENSVKIVEELKTNFVTSGIVSIADSKRYSVYNQLQIENYVVLGHHFKSMIDKVIIDHQSKTIEPIDLKCTWSVDNFFREYYLLRRAYIQAFLYWRACQEYFAQDDELKFYEVLPTKFIVCDSINYMNPLIYTLNKKDLKDAYNGFEVNNRFYPGVEEIITELKWTIENNMWNMYKKHYECNGIINIRE